MRRNAKPPIRVYIVGAGKVGTALAKASRDAGHPVALRAARKGLPTRPIDANLVILAVRDGALRPLATELAASGLIATDAVCVHVAGALDADVIAPLRGHCAGIAQMHPMVSFASKRANPTVVGAFAHISGDADAVRRARAFVKTLGMLAHTARELDPVGYHAAAALTANGAVALAALSARLLLASGVDHTVVPRALGALLGSVAQNITRLGFPEALTGPVRRGDSASLQRHLKTLNAQLPEATELYRASLRIQVELAHALGEADPKELDAILGFVG